MAVAVHQRQHRSVLAGAEKRLLIRLARRLPLAIRADHLSGLALASMIVAAVGFALLRTTPRAAIIVVAGLAGNWFGDSLDGTVARVRGHERPRFGFYVDHVIDLLGTVTLFVGIACSGVMTPVLALGVLAGYLLVCAESFLATHATGVFRLSAWGIGPTELRILLAVGACYAARGATVLLPWGARASLFDLGGSIAIAGLAVAFVTAAWQQTIALYRAEPRRSSIVSRES